MKLTHRQLNDNFDSVLLFGESVVALRKKMNDLANSKEGHLPISDELAAEINQVAGFTAAERKALKPVKPRVRPSKPLPLL